MAKGPAYNLAGTFPHDHNLADIRRALQEHPRELHYAVVQIRNMRTSVDHPVDGPDERNPILVIDSLYVITDAKDREHVEMIENRARLEAPGQHTLDDAARGEADEVTARQRAESEQAERQQAARDELAARRGGGEAGNA